MPYPTKYTRQFDYQSYQGSNPTRPLPGDKHNADYNAVENSIDEIVDALGLIQRSDGRLANNSVGLDQLDPSVDLGFAYPTVWAAGTDYTDNSTVFHEGNFYKSAGAHTAGGVFDADDWELILDLGQDEIDATLASALVAQAAAEAAAVDAESAETAAEAAQAAAEAAQAAAEAAAAETEAIGGALLHEKTVAALAQFATAPPGPVTLALDRAIRRLNNGGWFTTLDVLGFLWAHADGPARVNLIAPGTTDLTVVGTDPTHTAGEGYDNSGASGNYLTTGAALNSLTHYQQDDCFAFVLPFENVAADTPDMGVVSGGGAGLLALNSRTAGNLISAICNAPTALTVTNPISNSRAFTWCGRDPLVPGFVNIGQDDVQIGAAQAQASEAPSAGTLALFRSAATISARGLSAAGVGHWPTGGAAKIAELNDILREFGTALLDVYPITSPTPLRVLHLTDIDLKRHFGCRPNGRDMSGNVLDAFNHLVEKSGGTMRLGDGKYYLATKVTPNDLSISAAGQANAADISMLGSGRMVSGFYTDNEIGLFNFLDPEGWGSVEPRDFGLFSAATNGGEPLRYAPGKSGARSKYMFRAENLYIGPYDQGNDSLHSWSKYLTLAQTLSGTNNVSPRRVKLKGIKIESGFALNDEYLASNPSARGFWQIYLGQCYGPQLEDIEARARTTVGVLRYGIDDTPEGALNMIGCTLNNSIVPVVIKSDSVGSGGDLVGFFIDACHINYGDPGHLGVGETPGVGMLCDGIRSGYLADTQFHNSGLQSEADIVVVDGRELLFYFNHPRAAADYHIVLDPARLDAVHALIEPVLDEAGITYPATFLADQRVISDVTVNVGRFAGVNATAIVKQSKNAVSNLRVITPAATIFDLGRTVTEVVETVGHTAAAILLSDTSPIYGTLADHNLADGTPLTIGSTANPPTPLDETSIFYAKIVNDNVTISQATPGIVTKVVHGQSVDNRVRFTTSVELPAPLVEHTVYFVQSVPTADTLTLAETLGGAAIATTTPGDGTHTMHAIDTVQFSATAGGAAINYDSGTPGSGTHTLTALSTHQLIIPESLIASATTAELADKNTLINTRDKWAGKKVWESTLKIEYRASGPDLTDDWEPVDGGTAVTPA